LQSASREGLEAGPSKGAPNDGYDKEAQMEVDARSIYVGNVEYNVDSKEIAEFFSVRTSTSTQFIGGLSGGLLCLEWCRHEPHAYRAVEL
jgi:hypothetical protein